MMTRIYLWVFLSAVISSSAVANITDHYKVITEKTTGHGYGPIDFVYVVNLDHRPEKLSQTRAELSPYGIQPFRFSAVHGFALSNSTLQDVGLKFEKGMRPGALGTVFRWHNGKEYKSHEMIQEEGVTYFGHCISKGAIGIVLSQASVMHDAYLSGYDLVWIMEDDIEVLQNPSKILQCIKELDNSLGRDNWHALFTDRDYRGPNGEIPSHDPDHHPGVDTRNTNFAKYNYSVSTHVRRVGTRFGATSMIWTRSGMKKFLDFIENYGVFSPYDMEYYLPHGMKLFTPKQSIITNRLDAISDNGRNPLNLKPKQ